MGPAGPGKLGMEKGEGKLEHGGRRRHRPSAAVGRGPLAVAGRSFTNEAASPKPSPLGKVDCKRSAARRMRSPYITPRASVGIKARIESARTSSVTASPRHLPQRGRLLGSAHLAFPSGEGGLQAKRSKTDEVALHYAPRLRRNRGANRIGQDLIRPACGGPPSPKGKAFGNRAPCLPQRGKALGESRVFGCPHPVHML